MESDNDQHMESDGDRISALPTEILHNIISLVPIRSVVRMRRLSKSWRQVCESLQFICLQRKEFEYWTVDTFAHFVNNLLLLRSSVDLHTFQLFWLCHEHLDSNNVRMWIGYAVKHNVKVLDVILENYDQHVLPHCVFTCPSLQDLKLRLGKASGGHVGFVLPDNINLPSLKWLTLINMEVSQLSLDQIIARSPGLEELNLIGCAAHFQLIDSKVLKSLYLASLIYVHDGFTIAAPCLIDFVCFGCALEEMHWRECPSLECAHIDTCGTTFDDPSGFIQFLLRVKTLGLLNSCGSDVKAMLEKELPACSMFENLQTLEIGGWCLTDNIYIILRFLQLSPRLEQLTLVQEELSVAAKRAGIDAMPINGMTFQCPRLETVIIKGSRDDGEIDKMVTTMVANGVSLDKIHVNFYDDMETKAITAMIHRSQEQEKELSILEKILKDNPEWVDDSSYAELEDEEDALEYEDNDEESEEEEVESEDEDDGLDEDNDGLEDGVDNSEDDNGDGL